MTKKQKPSFDPIISLEPMGRRQCYDFEIPTHHNFYANQILVHNSGAIEELADCVLMLWWQELGTEEEPQGTRYWVCVEKQRYGPPGQKVPIQFDKDHLTFLAAEHPVTEWSPPADATTPF